MVTDALAEYQKKNIRSKQIYICCKEMRCEIFYVSNRNALDNIHTSINSY